MSTSPLPSSPRKRAKSEPERMAIFDGKEYICPPGYRLSISRNHKPIGTDGIVQEYIQNVKQTGYRCPENCKFTPIRNKKKASTRATAIKSKKRHKVELEEGEVREEEEEEEEEQGHGKKIKLTLL